MIDRMCWRSALGLSLLIACGSGSSSNPADNPGADGGAPDDGAAPDGGGGPDVVLDAAPDGAACGPAACTGVAGACGAMVDPCGQDVACEPCRYTPESVTDGEDAPVALALAQDAVVAVREQLGTRS